MKVSCLSYTLQKPDFGNNENMSILILSDPCPVSSLSCPSLPSSLSPDLGNRVRAEGGVRGGEGVRAEEGEGGGGS